MPDQPHTDQLGPKRTWTFCLAILALVIAGDLIRVTRVPIPVRAPRLQIGDRAAEREQRINPNVAPWWELAQLPGLGEKTAKRIVAHRQSVGPIAFRQLADLDPIHRVGPATLAKISPFLKFPNPPPAS